MSNVTKTFFGYFNALKTHSEKGIQCTKSKFYFPNICCALHNAWALAFGAAEIEFKEIHEKDNTISQTEIIQPGYTLLPIIHIYGYP